MSADTHADHDHDDDHEGHDHDHDHDHELSEEEEAQAEADVAKMGEALGAVTDDVLREALLHMSDKSRQDVAVQLQLPRATMFLGDGLMPLVRRKLKTAGPEHQLQVLFALAEPVNDETIKLLGDRSEDPTKEDILEVLPTVLEHHPTEL